MQGTYDDPVLISGRTLETILKAGRVVLVRMPLVAL